MNVSLRKHFLSLLMLMASALGLWGQNIVELETFQNQSVQHVLFSSPIDPAVVLQPSNGSITVKENPPSNHTITYTPKPGYLGQDVIRLAYWTCPSCVNMLQINIKVLPSKVQAELDYAVIATKEPVTIDVLANDYSSTGNLSLTALSMVNSGAATISSSGSQFEFTPEEGFTGYAYFNYVVCNELGACDNGTVVVNVVEVENPSQIINLFTKRNTSQFVFVPGNIALNDDPDHGQITGEPGSTMVYSPDKDFTGLDLIGFSDGLTINMTVLDFQANMFAFDDEFFGVQDFPLECRVLDNDLYGTKAGCVYIKQKPQFGTLKYSANNGIFVYYPNRGFQGVDEFTYTSRGIGCSGSEEEATVRIFVSNYEPSSSKYQFVTPKKTPIILKYAIPTTDFHFHIKDDGELGHAEFKKGRVDTVLYGRPFSGANFLLYLPDEQVNSGVDEFEAVYCLLKDGACHHVKSVKIEVEILDIGDGSEPMCFDDCVWPGDTNADGIVNVEDVLPLGLEMGQVGLPRENANQSTWYGQYGVNWIDLFDESPVNLKHLDTNGDSLISAQDTSAIRKFYGRTHAITPKKIPFAGFELYLKGDGEAFPGDLVELELWMGYPDEPVIDLYGFAFPFDYHPKFIDPTSVQFLFSGNSWLGYNSPVLSMHFNDLKGKIETAITRTSGKTASGYGKIGTLSLVVTDNIGAIKTTGSEFILPVGGGEATFTNGAGQTFGVKMGETQIKIKLRQPGEIEEQLKPDWVKIFPNPANGGFVNLNLNGGREFQRLEVFNMAGQKVYAFETAGTRRTQIDISRWQSGLYVARVFSNGEMVNNKFEIIK